MSHDVSFEELIDYAEGRLDEANAQHVSQHLEAGCPACAEGLNWLRRTLGLMAADRLVAAPPALVERVQGLYRPPRPEPRRLLAGLYARLQGTARLRWTPQVRYAAIALATLLALAGTWWLWGNATVAQAATLTEVRGAVEVRLPGSATWQPAVAGMSLAAGSALRSGPGASAVLLYANGSRTQVGEEAQVELLRVVGRRNGRASHVRLNLVAGHTQHRLANGNSSVRVEAAGAAAQATRGDYEVGLSGTALEVRAERGEVAVQVEETTTFLKAGEHGWVKGGRLQVTPAASAPGRSGHPDKDPTTTRGRGKPSHVGRTSLAPPPGQSKKNEASHSAAPAPGKASGRKHDPVRGAARGSQPKPPQGRGPHRR